MLVGTREVDFDSITSKYKDSTLTNLANLLFDNGSLAVS